MTTKEDIKKLRVFINTSKRTSGGLRMPKNIETIIDNIVSEYEMKYDL